jgi:hypothetical protein
MAFLYSLSSPTLPQDDVEAQLAGGFKFLRAGLASLS